MFDIGWTELLVIGVVALIAIGPKELPGALRSLGHWMGKIRRMASEFQGQFNEAMREAEVADIQKQIDSMTEGLDPIESLRKEVDAAIGDNPATPDPAPSAATASASEAVPPPEAQATTAVEAPVAPTAREPDRTVAEAEVKEAGGRAA
jgi:sec-independent protein translocase protein TatB